MRLIGKAVRFTDDPQKLDQGALAEDEAHDEDASLVPVLEKVEPPNVQLRIVMSVIHIVKEDEAPKHKKSWWKENNSHRSEYLPNPLLKSLESVTLDIKILYAELTLEIDENQQVLILERNVQYEH